LKEKNVNEFIQSKNICASKETSNIKKAGHRLDDEICNAYVQERY
jgi:hypothetical protein